LELISLRFRHFQQANSTSTMRIVTKTNDNSDMNSNCTPIRKVNNLSDNRFTTDKTESLLISKSRFTATVSRTISDLMGQWGYSRTRATTILLQLIRDDNDPPSDAKVFQLMDDYGVGFEDASQVLTVSEAIENTSKDKKIPHSQAADELSSKLSNLSNLNFSNSALESKMRSFEELTSTSIKQFPLSTSSATNIKSKFDSKEHIKNRESIRSPSSIRTRSSTRYNSTSNNNNLNKRYHKRQNGFGRPLSPILNQNNISSSKAQDPFQSTYTPQGKNHSDKSSQPTASPQDHDSQLNLKMKKPKLGNAAVNPDAVENHSQSLDVPVASSRIIKNLTSPSTNSKRKRESVEHLNAPGIVLNDSAAPVKKPRTSSV